MSRRWTEEEELALAEVRRRLKDLIDQQPPFPEVVGDRRLLRFLRGKQMNVDEATDLYRDFLLWRKKNDVDQIRQEILYGGRNSPFFFPKGKMILDLAPQIIVTPHSRDREGRPLCLEQYCFNPKEVLKVVSLDEYLYFLIYALEYRAMVMEQLSHEMETDYVQRFPNAKDRVDGYGVVLLDFTIRDLKGVGFNHLGSDGRNILKAALDLGLPNYPEFLGKSHMINVPTLFSTMWYFLKQILDEPTQAKFEFTGYDYLAQLEKNITLENIPSCLGGEFELYNEPFNFDTSAAGPFHYAEADSHRQAFLQRSPFLTFDFETAQITSAQFYDDLVGKPRESRDGSSSSNSSSSGVIAKPNEIPVVVSASDNSSSSSSAKSMLPRTATASVKSMASSSTTTRGSSVSAGSWLAASMAKISVTRDFWAQFVRFCWSKYPFVSLAGLLAAASLLYYDPVAVHALAIAVLVVYFFCL